MTRRLFSLGALAATLILVGFLVPTQNPATADTPPNVIKLIPGDGAAGDIFGYATAADGDIIIVGACWDDDNGTDSGSVYVFVREGDSWIQQAKLLPDDGAEYDYFGHNVAIQGDTVLASAFGDDDNGPDSGSAYVFVREGSTWTQEAKLITSDGQAGDLLAAVDLSGDTAAVGAREATVNGHADAGAVYVFERDGTTWTEQAKIVAGDPQYRDWFGFEVAIDGDTLVAAAILEDSGGVNAGAAYVFVRSDDTWSQQAKLVSGEECYSCYLGSYLALEGDTLMVSAPIYPAFWYQIGCTYVFERNGTAWSKTQRLQASDGAEYDIFGRFVALDGDTAVITALLDDDTGTDSGSAYVFARINGSWAEQSKLLAPDGAAGDQFGYSVGLSGGTLIVGAPFADVFGEDSGAAYVWGPAVTTVAIDVKPGSYPNCFNVNGHGVLPVAILGSDSLDVNDIDVSSLAFAGLDVRVKGNGTPQCAVEDVSGDFTFPEGAPDGFPDLVCQFVDDPATWEPGDDTATLTGMLNDGTAIEGADEICIVP